MRCNHIHRRNNRCYRPRQGVPPQPYVYMDSVGEISAQVGPFSPHTQTSSSEFIIPYSPSNADNPLGEIATDTSDITIASMMIDGASDGGMSFIINAGDEGTATLSYWAVNNPEDIKTIEVTVGTPTPVTPIPNNNILIEPTRGNAIVKFFAIDETSEDYVEASIDYVELENISYHGACGGNEYCQGMFSNRTVVRNLGKALGNYIDYYGIPEDGALYFSEDVYDSVEDYFAGEITAAQLGRDIRDAEQAIVPDDPSGPFAITSVDTDSTSVTVGNSQQYGLNYTPGSANPKKHIIITSTDDSIATAHIDDYYPDGRARIWFDGIGVGVATVTLSDGVNNYDVEVTVEELPCDDPCNPECPNYNPCECDPCSQDCPDRDPCDCNCECGEGCDSPTITWIDQEMGEIVLTEEEPGYGIGYMSTCINPECGNYENWSVVSTDDEVANGYVDTEVDNFQIDEGGKNGTCTITVSDGTNSYDYTVTRDFEPSVWFDHGDTTINVGGTGLLYRGHTNTSHSSHSVDNANVVVTGFGSGTLDEMEIRGDSVGTSVVTYNTDSGLSAQVTITVVDPTAPTFFIDMDNSNDGSNTFYNLYGQQFASITTVDISGTQTHVLPIDSVESGGQITVHCMPDVCPDDPETTFSRPAYASVVIYGATSVTDDNGYNYVIQGQNPTNAAASGEFNRVDGHLYLTDGTYTFTITAEGGDDETIVCPPADPCIMDPTACGCPDEDPCDCGGECGGYTISFSISGSGRMIQSDTGESVDNIQVFEGDTLYVNGDTIYVRDVNENDRGFIPAPEAGREFLDYENYPEQAGDGEGRAITEDVSISVIFEEPLE